MTDNEERKEDKRGKNELEQRKVRLGRKVGEERIRKGRGKQ